MEIRTGQSVTAKWRYRNRLQNRNSWSATGHGTVDTLVRQTDLSQAALAEVGKPFLPERFRLSKELYIAPTKKQVERECYPYIKAKYDAYTSCGQDSVLPQGERFTGSIAELAQNRFIIGTPEDCIEEVSQSTRLSNFATLASDFTIRGCLTPK